MEQKKVRLPREVAEALEKILKDEPDLDKDRQFIVWNSAHAPNKFDSGPWGVLYDFVGSGNIFLLADALRYGYVIDEPIRVEITTEQQEKIRRYYESISKDDEESEEFKRGEQLGFREAYDLAGIKIDGVNA
jgi:hypothetical protein